MHLVDLMTSPLGADLTGNCLSNPIVIGTPTQQHTKIEFACSE